MNKIKKVKHFARSLIEIKKIITSTTKMGTTTKKNWVCVSVYIEEEKFYLQKKKQLRHFAIMCECVCKVTKIYLRFRKKKNVCACMCKKFKRRNNFSSIGIIRKQ